MHKLLLHPTLKQTNLIHTLFHEDQLNGIVTPTYCLLDIFLLSDFVIKFMYISLNTTDNIKMDLQEVGCGLRTGSSWLRIGTGGEHF